MTDFATLIYFKPSRDLEMYGYDLKRQFLQTI